tara:strand:- start:1875 stop:2261 length:387 start_codon:yes stop_codon:yes gene_type:complete
MIFELTEENFNIYAIKHYDNPACKGMAEYNDDLKRFRYLKRLFKKYKSENDLKERLILNHIVVLYNLFGPEASTKMLFFKIDKPYWSQLKTFLIMINIMPEVITKNGEVYMESDIAIDPYIVDILRKL